MASPPSFPFNQEIAWTPDDSLIRQSNLRRFMDRQGIETFDALLDKAADDVAWFWDAVIKDLDIRFYEPYRSVLNLDRGIEFPEWCVDGRMNIVHNCLDKWLEDERGDRVALRWEGEEGATRTMTYRELNAEVCRCAQGLRSLGLAKGDAVGLFMPMTPEIVVAFLAIAKIGGIILPLFSGYGPDAIATRLKDAGARALFTSDGFYRRGRAVEMKSVADEALRSCPDVRRVIVHRRTGRQGISWTSGRDISFDDLLAGQSIESPTEQSAAEDIVMIIYTSGTTGRPKGAVHTHCGFPIKAAQDMFHCMDVKPGETVYWMSDMGWMMGPWLVFGTLLLGSSMVLYDGAPDHPDVDRLWELTARHEVTHLGISPTLIRALKAQGEEPVQRHDLSRLRAVGSTGSPWDPDSWKWLFHTVLGGSKPILNYSGGTEISGGILCGNFFTPLKPCAFSGPVPGMAADVVDATGEPVRARWASLSSANRGSA
ncbi:MAG: AMP-binding protein [Bacteroidota bacterium]